MYIHLNLHVQMYLSMCMNMKVRPHKTKYRRIVSPVALFRSAMSHWVYPMTYVGSNLGEAAMMLFKPKITKT